jgi:ABC-2 type transport system ATP-binding protein
VPRTDDARRPGHLAIETAGLTKRYGDRVAVDGLDLAVPAGAVTGFVGPNGAGKTTTIRMLLGLIRPTAGSGRVLGHPLDDAVAFLPRVGALVDGPAHYVQLSGRDNLAVLARLAGHDGRVDSLLALTGLADRADDRVETYSLGMRQRLAIAAALLTEPDLVILDEPTTGLDPAGIREIRALLRRLADAGTSVFVSSHQLAELEQICDHLVLLRSGRLVYQGSLPDLLALQPANIVAVPENPDHVDDLVGIADGCGWANTLDEGIVTITSPDASAGLLNRLAHERGVTLEELWRRPPTLEETFLALTTAPAAPTASDSPTAPAGPSAEEAP